MLNRIKSPSLSNPFLKCCFPKKVRRRELIQNMFEINYSQLIQFEILEKLVTCIDQIGCLQEGHRKLVDVWLMLVNEWGGGVGVGMVVRCSDDGWFW